MDKLSDELNRFLVNLGKAPERIDKKTTHHMEHIISLLTTENETVLKEYYGLFGVKRYTTEEIARIHGLSPEDVENIIKNGVRKLAVTPEWQMVKQTI